MLTVGELPIEAVIVSSIAKARTYYTHDGSRLCHSSNGVRPCVSSEQPQAKQCAVCTQNQWGSRITPNGKRGKACAEYSQLGLLQPDVPSDQLSLRVPSTSLKSFRDFEKSITTRGEKLSAVVTKIDATHGKTHSVITFRIIRFLEDGELNTLKELSQITASQFAVTDGYTH
jgi:hypothetical protein